ncbi:hypothetical protein BC835DRAFT_1307905 [Cytidiella melzeri]|nr:hypothetical protein BC835DRAFT_1307905 [Cytidiella melzeri]
MFIVGNETDLELEKSQWGYYSSVKLLWTKALQIPQWRAKEHMGGKVYAGHTVNIPRRATQYEHSKNVLVVVVVLAKNCLGGRSEEQAMPAYPSRTRPYPDLVHPEVQARARVFSSANCDTPSAEGGSVGLLLFAALVHDSSSALVLGQPWDLKKDKVIQLSESHKRGNVVLGHTWRVDHRVGAEKDLWRHARHLLRNTADEA